MSEKASQFTLTHTDFIQAARKYAQKFPEDPQGAFDHWPTGAQWVMRVLDGHTVENEGKQAYCIFGGVLRPDFSLASIDLGKIEYGPDPSKPKHPMSELKVPLLSLWQPWANAVVTPDILNNNQPIKLNETRHWATEIRGRVLIHASKKWDKSLRKIAEGWPFSERTGDLGIDANWFGAIVGSVEIVDCITSEQWVLENLPATDDETLAQALMGNFLPERYIFKLANPVRFVQPIPFKGMQTPFVRVPLSTIPECYYKDFNTVELCQKQSRSNRSKTK